MRYTKRPIIWTVLFLMIFLLSLDFWSWDEAVQLGPLNLPVFVYYFAFLQLLFAAAVHVFAKKYWNDASPQKNPETE